MKKRNKIGPRIAPYLTPIVFLIVLSISSIRNLKLKSLCRSLRWLTSLIGTSNLTRISQSNVLGTRSKALTKSSNRTQDFNPCSLLFLKADLIVKIESTRRVWIEHDPGSFSLIYCEKTTWPTRPEDFVIDNGVVCSLGYCHVLDYKDFKKIFIWLTS